MPDLPGAESDSGEADPRARFDDLVVFKLDFDTQKDELRALKAQSQSTLIVFKGESEKARTVGDTNPLSIEELLDSAL